MSKTIDSILNKDTNREHKDKWMIPSTKMWCMTTTYRIRNCTNLKNERFVTAISTSLLGLHHWQLLLALGLHQIRLVASGFKEYLLLLIYHVLKKRCVYVGWVFSRRMFRFCNLISLGFIQHLTLCLWRWWHGFHIRAMVVVSGSQTVHRRAFSNIKGSALLQCMKWALFRVKADFTWKKPFWVLISFIIPQCCVFT